jgi:hypothetical protein
MTDDERIARLTELARRVPEWRDVQDLEVVGGGDELLLDSWDRGRLLSCDHPRALAAVEAALLVLARKRPAWVGQLAREWKQLAQSRRALLHHDEDDRLRCCAMADAFDFCAAQLDRFAELAQPERAKGEP